MNGLIRLLAAAAGLACASIPSAYAVEYRVGPNSTYKVLGDVIDDLRPGDTLSLEGGATFTGAYTITVSATATAPLTIQSHGTGRAKMQSSSGAPLRIRSSNHVKISNVDFAFTGAPPTSGSIMTAGLMFEESYNVSVESSTIRSNTHGVYFRLSGSGGTTKYLNASLRNLTVLGDDVGALYSTPRFNTKGSGIYFQSIEARSSTGSVSASHFAGITITDSEVTGFGHYAVSNQHGIGVSFKGPEKVGYGYRNVVLDRLRVHNNEIHGIKFWSRATSDLSTDQNSLGRYDMTSGDQRANNNIVIRNSYVYRNRGKPGVFSGSGMSLGELWNATVENNRAYSNGDRHNMSAGPCGILVSNSRFVTFTRNSSYSNRTAGTWDGCGFDFDWGVTDSEMTYNLSYDNHGNGFFACSPDPAKVNNARRLYKLNYANNYSERDGYKMGVSPFSIKLSGYTASTVVMGNCLANDGTMKPCSGLMQTIVRQNGIAKSSVGSSLPELGAPAPSPSPSVSPSPAPSPSPSPSPSPATPVVLAPQVTQVKITNGGSTTLYSNVIGGSASISLSQYPGFKIVAVGNSATVSVKMVRGTYSRTEKVAPFEFVKSDFLGSGTYTVKVTPYSGTAATGTAGASATFTLTLRN